MTGARHRPAMAFLGGWVCTGLGLLGAVLGWILDPRSFAAAWLAALLTWLFWPLGSLALLLAHSLTGGRWGEQARPGCVAGIATLPLLIPAAIPLLLTLHPLYHWAAEEPGHLKNGAWLNVPFFLGRLCVYAAVWLGLGSLVLRRTWRGETLASLAPAGLIVLAVSFTFGMFDLGMSLENVTTNIYGMLAASDAGLLALALAVLAAGAENPRASLADLGKLQLALVVLWAYLFFMQLLIVWQSNLATDADYYVRRTTPYWSAVSILLAVLRFLVPFALLIWPGVQRSGRGLRRVSVLLVATTAVEVWWMVLPAQQRAIGPVDVACLLLFGGASWLLTLRRGRNPVRVAGVHV